MEQSIQRTTRERRRIIDVGSRKDRMGHHETKVAQSATLLSISEADLLAKPPVLHPDPAECEANLALAMSM